MPVDIYEKIMESLQDKGVKFIVDTTGESLLKVLKYKPFLIKPNHHELGDLFNVKLNGNDEIIEYAKKLKEMGAGKVKNSVGAGDSMVAGFIAGYLEANDIEKGFKLGVATGSASAFSEGLATKDYVYELLNQIN